MASKRSEEVVVTSLGDLFTGPNEHKYWSSKRGRNRYPYPVGYQATRLQGGQEYQLEVAAGPYGPEFVVTDPRGVCFSAETALRVWSIALRSNGRAGHIQENTDAGEIFGFNQPMVKKYLQDLVAKAEPHASVATTSAPALSPLVCNTPNASRGKRKTAPKETPKPLTAKASPSPSPKASPPVQKPTPKSASAKASPSQKPTPKPASAKKPASSRASKWHAKKSKGENAENTQVLGPAKESLLEAADRKPSQNHELDGVSGEAEGSGKRQKLGELPSAAREDADGKEKSTGAVGAMGAGTRVEKVRHSLEPVLLKRDVEIPSLDGNMLGTRKRRTREEVQNAPKKGGGEILYTRAESEEGAEQHAEASAEEAHPRLEPVLSRRDVEMMSISAETEGGSKRQKPGEVQSATRGVPEAEDARVQNAGAENAEASRAGTPEVGVPAEASAEKVDFGPEPTPLESEDARTGEEGGDFPGVPEGHGERGESSGDADGRRALLAVETGAKLRQRDALRASLEANRAMLARSRAIRSLRLGQSTGQGMVLSQDPKNEAQTAHEDAVERLPQSQPCKGPAGESASKRNADDEEADSRWGPSDGLTAAGELVLEGVESAVKSNNGSGKQGPLCATETVAAADGLSGVPTGSSAGEETEQGPVEEHARDHSGSLNQINGEGRERHEGNRGEDGVGGVGLGSLLGPMTEGPREFPDDNFERKQKLGSQATEVDSVLGSTYNLEVQTDRCLEADTGAGVETSTGSKHSRRPESPEGCPNHRGGCGRLSWSVDMEAETESESGASQSVSAQETYLGRPGVTEAESIPVGVGTDGVDVSMLGGVFADVSRSEGNGADVSRKERPGAGVGGIEEPGGNVAWGADGRMGTSRKADSGRVEGLGRLGPRRSGKRRPVDGLVLPSDRNERSCKATQPTRSAAKGIKTFLEEVGSLGCEGVAGQQGGFADGIGRHNNSADGRGLQNNFADDITECGPSPSHLERELPLSAIEGLKPEGRASAFDFEDETGGWFTAVRGRRGRKGALAGLVGLPGSDKSKSSARIQAGTPMSRIGGGSRKGGCGDDVTQGTEQNGSDRRADARSGAAAVASLEAKPRKKIGKRRKSEPSAPVGVPVAGRIRNGSEVGTDGNQAVADRKRQAYPEEAGEKEEPPSAERGRSAPGSRDETLAEGGVEVAPAAPPSQRESLVPSQGGRKRARRLSLTPFKAAMEWMATEEGKDTAKELKVDVGIRVEGQPSEKCGRGNGRDESGGDKSLGSVRHLKPKMGRLKRLSTSEWGQVKGEAAEVEPTVSVTVANNHKEKQVGVADVSGGIEDDRTVARGAPLEPLDKKHLDARVPGVDSETQAPDATTGVAAMAEVGEAEAGFAKGGPESRGQTGGAVKAVEKRAVRIVGSDSLTEQQSETEADEGAGGGALIEAAVGLGTAGGELTAVKESGGLEIAVPGLRELAIPEEPFQKRCGGEKRDADERREADAIGEMVPSEVVGKAETAEADNDGSVKKGGLTHLGARSNVPLPNSSAMRSCIDGPPQNAPSGGLKARSDRLAASSNPIPEGSPERTALMSNNPASSGDSKRSSSWFSRAVEKVSSTFIAQPGYKPLALTRSRDSVSNGAGEAHPANVDTSGKEWSEKSRPRNKSWPIWTGPTSNLNLVTAGGSAQKAPREQPVTADVSRMTSLSCVFPRRGQSKALESQAQRFGRFEESEAVRDWSAGDFLVPSTQPESPTKGDPLEMNGPDCSGRKEADLRQGVSGNEGLVNGHGETSCKVQTDAETVGQGLQRDALSTVCCLVHQTGPVVWTVVHVAGQVARLGVCIQNDGAERSVFVYSLRMAAKPSDWKVDVVGALLGSVRSAEDSEQVSSSVPFLEFSLDGEVLVVSDALVLNVPSPAEAASKRPCIRLVSLVQQRPQVLARLECASAASCLLAAGPRVLAAGEKQGVVECWMMSADWRSHDGKWSLPVARYRGVTFPAIRQLLKVPGRANQLLGCSENGSFALWDTQKRTLLSTCHSMHHVISSAHVLSIPLPVSKELRQKVAGPEGDPGTAHFAGTAGHTKTSLHTEAALAPGADKQAGISVNAGEDVGTETAGHTEERIPTGLPVHDVGVDADGVKPLCLLVRATERQDPGRGASCCAALLEGDGIAVGKELLAAESSVHLAALGGIGVAADDRGRILLWDAPTGRAVGLLRDLEGAFVSSVSAQEEAGILAVGARDGRVAVYSQNHGHMS